MIGINFDTLLRTEVFLSEISAALGDFRRFFTAYLAPFTYAEIDDIFETEGRGAWAPLDPIYAARKAVSHPDKGILTLDGTYRNAATHPNHPGSWVEVSQTELVLGVRGTYFESTFGANYPGLHEEGNDDQNLSARPVYELIAAGEGFAQRMGQLGEKWQREAITTLQRNLR